MSKDNHVFVPGRAAIADTRDKKYKMAIPKRTRTRRLWNTQGIHLDQGNRPICVATAWLHWLAASPIRQGIGLDPEGLYRYGQMEDEWEGEDYDGTSVRGVAQVLEVFGVFDEYRWSWDAEDIATFVLESAPVVFGSDWYEGMDWPNPSAVMSMTGDNLGGHAYLLCGYNAKNEMFRVKNSWGTEWADGGYANLSLPNVQRLLDDDAEACCGIERSVKKVR